MFAKNVRGYARVSTELQLDGVSLDVQEMRIRSYCTQSGYNLVKMYKDVLSGKDTNRPQLQLMLSELKPGEIVAVVDLSRLSRTTLDSLQLIDQFSKMKVGFVSINQPIDTTTPAGETLLTMQIAFNQMERKSTALKVKGAMQALKQQGKLRGKPPFGWKFVGKDRDFEPEPEQQRVLEKIKQLHANGTSMTRIAAILNHDGDNKCLVNNKKDHEKFKDALFYQPTIKRILVENGLMDGGTMKRKPVQLQIMSHHKSSHESSKPLDITTISSENSEDYSSYIEPYELPPSPAYIAPSVSAAPMLPPPPPIYHVPPIALPPPPTHYTAPVSLNLPPPPLVRPASSIPRSLPPPPTIYNTQN